MDTKRNLSRIGLSLLILSIPAVAFGVTLTGNIQFKGNLAITGSISKGSGTFVIDDPIDPANKLLYHSFVESPDVKNIYDGIVVLDKNGEATVQLPNYFEALNKDFRYLVRPMGTPMPNLYISKEVENNQFGIAGGVSGGQVSWQVTGIRHDPYIVANPITVEVEKSKDTLVDKGAYVYPAGFENSSSWSFFTPFTNLFSKFRL